MAPLIREAADLPRSRPLRVVRHHGGAAPHQSCTGRAHRPARGVAMTTRRSFIASGAAAVSAMAASPARALGTAEYDLVIRGGTLFDGTGTAGVPRDVAIANGRIAAVAARVRGRGADEIDGRGLVVAPGFIDTHSHADGSIADDPRSESVVRQGITTIVVGQDGSSRATGGDDRPFGAMLSATAALTPSVNVASFVGFGSVRGAVVGNDSRKATAAELATMTAMVERALAEGAYGGSSGLEYTPGAFADLAELTALARPLAARRLPYATHMRNEDDRLLDAIDESIAVARGAGSPQLGEARRRLRSHRPGGVKRRGHLLRPLPLRGLLDRAHQSLSGVEPGRRNFRLPRAPRGHGGRAADTRRDARESGADRRLGQRPDLRGACAGRQHRPGTPARRLCRVARLRSVRAGGRAAAAERGQRRHGRVRDE